MPIFPWSRLGWVGSQSGEVRGTEAAAPPTKDWAPTFPARSALCPSAGCTANLCRGFRVCRVSNVVYFCSARGYRGPRRSLSAELRPAPGGARRVALPSAGHRPEARAARLLRTRWPAGHPAWSVGRDPAGPDGPGTSVQSAPCRRRAGRAPAARGQHRAGDGAGCGRRDSPTPRSVECAACLQGKLHSPRVTELEVLSPLTWADSLSYALSGNHDLTVAACFHSQNS